MGNRSEGLKSRRGRVQKPAETPDEVDLSWLSAVSEEVEQHLLPTERCILVALRRYQAMARKPGIVSQPEEPDQELEHGSP